MINNKNNNVNSPKCIIDNDKTINFSTEIANVFNKYFSKIGKNLASSCNNSLKTDFTKFIKNSICFSIYLEPPQINKTFKIIYYFLKKHKICAHYITNLGHINAFFLLNDIL